tara:strand:- start:49 stop:927 length:879 start_codon:yes stop_codon:yes gene_type:complete
MMPVPKVSIVMNCFNGELFLRESLSSILNQTFKDWELIFYNNASTDNSKNIFLSYQDQRFKYYESDTTTNLVDARNSAIQLISGEWIAILDVDDIWHEHKLEFQLNKLGQNHPFDFDLVFSSCNVLLNNKLKDIPINYTSEDVIDRLLSLDLSIPWSSVIFKKEILNEIGGFDSLYPSFHDLDFLIKASKITNFYHCNKTLVTIRHHKDSLSNQKKEKNGVYFEEIIHILNSYIEFSTYAYIGICKMKLRYIYLLVKKNSFKPFLKELTSLSSKELFYILQITYNFIFNRKL